MESNTIVVADTQVISYAMKQGGEYSAQGMVISSTVAQEFLNMRSRSHGRPLYYLPPATSLALDGYYGATGILRDHRARPLFRNSTDTLLMDFNNEYPS